MTPAHLAPTHPGAPMTRLLLALALLAWFVAACHWGRITSRLWLGWFWLAQHHACLCRLGLVRLCGRIDDWLLP